MICYINESDRNFLHGMLTKGYFCGILCYIGSGEMNKLSVEFDFFNENLDAIKQKYLNEFVVIKGKKIIGAYKSFDEAMNKTLKTEEIGTFLIQEVKKDPSAYTIYYNNITILA